MIRAGTLSWFARHELRLAWREWLALVTGGRKRRRWGVAAGLAAFAAFAHAMAWVVVGAAAPSTAPLMPTLIMITAAGLLLLPVMVSQAMETVTRAFYARADLDLILSSPVAAVRLFAVRIAAMAASVTLTAILISAPLIDVLAIRGGAGWLAAYGGVAAIGMVATSFAVAFVVALFRLIGPGRTRLVAQIVAAVIGAVFVIGIQVAAIMSYGTTRRPTTMLSDAVSATRRPRTVCCGGRRGAALGDPPAFVAVIAVALLVLGAAIAASRRLRPACHARLGHGARYGPPQPPFRRLPHPFSGADAAAQGMGAAAARPVAGLAEPDAASLSCGARGHPVAQRRRQPGRRHADRAGADHDRRPAFRRPDLGDHLGRGRARPDRQRAGLRPRRAARQARGGAGLRRHRVRAAGGRLRAARAVPCPGVAGGRRHRDRFGRHHPALVPRPGQAQQFRRRQTSSRLATFAEAISTITWAAAGAMAAMGNWFAAIGMGVFVVLILAGVRALSPARDHAA